MHANTDVAIWQHENFSFMLLDSGKGGTGGGGWVPPQDESSMAQVLAGIGRAISLILCMNEVRNSFLALHLAMKLFQSAWLPLAKSHDYCGLDNRWVWLKSCFSTVTGWLQCACFKLGIKYVSSMPIFRGEGALEQGYHVIGP